MPRSKDQRPLEAAPAEHGHAPYRADPQYYAAPPPPEKPTPHNLHLLAAYKLLKRVVTLELAEEGKSPDGRFRLVIDLTLQPDPDPPPKGEREVNTPGEQLAALSGGLNLLLERQLFQGQDFRILSREQQEILDKQPV